MRLLGFPIAFGQQERLFPNRFADRLVAPNSLQDLLFRQRFCRLNFPGCGRSRCRAGVGIGTDCAAKCPRSRCLFLGVLFRGFNQHFGFAEVGLCFAVVIGHRLLHLLAQASECRAGGIALVELMLSHRQKR